MMKKIYFFRVMLILCLSVFVFSCKEKQSSGRVLGPLSGSAGELMVVLDKDKWEGPIGDTVKQWFQQEELGLPQGEPMFDVLNLPPSYFARNMKTYRSVLYVRITDSIAKPTISFIDSPWARTQKWVQIEAPDNASFFNIFDANKQKIADTYLQAERERLVANYRSSPDTLLRQHILNKYNLDISIPKDYLVNKEGNNFMWISRETKVDSKGIIFFTKNYVDTLQFEKWQIIREVNRVLEENVPGPLKNTYMGLDTVTPIFTNIHAHLNTHYAMNLKGLWLVVNDFMGGPFVINVFLDEKENKVVYVMGYVYAPDDKKRNKTREIEAIVYTARPAEVQN